LYDRKEILPGLFPLSLVTPEQTVPPIIQTDNPGEKDVVLNVLKIYLKYK